MPELSIDNRYLDRLHGGVGWTAAGQGVAAAAAGSATLTCAMRAVTFLTVKIKTPLKLLSLLLSVVALTGCATKVRPTTPAVSMGDNTYSVTREATNGFNRDTDRLRAEAREDAARYCADHGKQMKIIAESIERPLMTLGYSSARIIFKALDAGDPALTAAPEPMPTSVVGAPPAQYQYPSAPGDLYTELNKLDDLRKRGILTDKEFEAEKKKILKHSH